MEKEKKEEEEKVENEEEKKEEGKKEEKEGRGGGGGQEENDKEEKRRELESFRSCASLRAASDHFQMSVIVFMVLSSTELPTSGICRWWMSESANQIRGTGGKPIGSLERVNGERENE